MKCVKSIKSTKNTEIGIIVRIDNNEAESRVKSGYWKYIPKNEWKESTREKYPTNVDGTNELKNKNKKSSKKVS
jgi:hypothetical protein